jgi:hypothetical protein
MAQTFLVNATGARFTVAVNHLKSKGSDCNDVGDPDLGDGQGNCSQTRRAAAEALVDWLATDPTGSGDPDFIIIGDLNSYAQEDSIDEIKAGSDDTLGTSDDFTNLINLFQGIYAYSYTFDGQAGYLDYALANESLLAQITGATEWHINSDEPDVLDYDTTFKPPSQDALFEVNPYRTSDHDPAIVGLNPVTLPSESSITGGGWVASQPGAYLPDPGISGKANFGFVAKYLPGDSLPSGNVEFQFAEANLNFKASGFDWLVVPDSTSAILKGTGTINGDGEYKFLLWTGDGKPDTMRIKIWQEVDGVEYVLYDNGYNQDISGSIVIHK